MGVPHKDESAAAKRAVERPDSTGQKLDRKFWLALGLYGILAVLAWYTLGDARIDAFGKPVEMRFVPLVVLGLFALRTYLAREADRIRRERQKAQGWDDGE